MPTDLPPRGQGRKPAAGRPRTPRKKKEEIVTVIDAPAAIAPDEAVLAAATVRQAADEVEALRARHEELLRALGEAERRVVDLRQRVPDPEELGLLRRTIEQARDEIETARRQAGDVQREAAAAVEKYREVEQTIETAGAAVARARQASAEAEASARQAREQADAAAADTARSRADLEALRAEWRATQEELRAAREDVRTLKEAAPAPAPQPPALPAHAEPTVRPADALAEVEPLPPDEVAEDARARLIRYLNDAAEVEREQAGLLQTLADATATAELRAEYERHRQRGQEHRDAVAGRTRALGGEPAGERGVFGQVVTRIWDALHRPRGSDPDPVEDLLKAISAAEFEAGVYRAVHALARAMGDAETAGLAAAHHRQEREFADRLRDHIAPAVMGPARRSRPAAE